MRPMEHYDIDKDWQALEVTRDPGLAYAKGHCVLCVCAYSGLSWTYSTSLPFAMCCYHRCLLSHYVLWTNRQKSPTASWGLATVPLEVVPATLRRQRRCSSSRLLS